MRRRLFSAARFQLTTAAKGKYAVASVFGLQRLTALAEGGVFLRSHMVYRYSVAFLGVILPVIAGFIGH
jgi:hypothetical protein